MLIPFIVVKRSSDLPSVFLKGVDEGVKAMVLRLPPFVYADGSSGFVKIQTGIAMGAGFAPYIGSGEKVAQSSYDPCLDL